MIKIKPLKPIIKETLKQINNINELVEEQIYTDKEITECIFKDINEDSINISSFDISKVKFEGCKCINFDFSNAELTDISFVNCDLSNCKFQEANLVRVEFINCKMVGTEFTESLLYNVYIKSCNAEYINLTLASIRETCFIESNLSSGYIEEVKLRSVEFTDCKLIATQFFKTNLNKMDLSSDIIDGIVVDIHDLKGAIVSELQALELSKLIGFKIKEDM